MSSDGGIGRSSSADGSSRTVLSASLCLQGRIGSQIVVFKLWQGRASPESSAPSGRSSSSRFRRLPEPLHGLDRRCRKPRCRQRVVAEEGGASQTWLRGQPQGRRSHRPVAVTLLQSSGRVRHAPAVRPPGDHLQRRVPAAGPQFEHATSPASLHCEGGCAEPPPFRGRSGRGDSSHCAGQELQTLSL